ncbi:phosphoribosylformylglycinamidine cyclo-ligase [Candidiatus Paracoxiella cheracis]|uniref:phosphoribosylformylglycinamidine cyclo-ligase n=1 Tax=Candidiatus Paracoxiella cheracis TaxID=3405120 RepID=UPI003BF5DF86
MPSMTNKNRKPLSYQDAGVDIEQANEFVENIKDTVKRTHRPGVIGNLGGFGGLFEIPNHYKNPILVSGTDGVGTKLKLAVALNHHDTIGIDLVAMCANDIVTSGAEPLFFLDYFSTGKLDLKQAQSIIKGIGKGCELAGAALIGGETAEMPGIYRTNEYDLAGFCVGALEKTEIIDGSKVRVNDALIGIASSGPHSNGYSLIRKIIDRHKINLSEPFENTTLGKKLLTSTRIYVKPILKLIKTIDVHAIAHITGGGLIENIPRVLPPKTKAIINVDSWEYPKIFEWIQQEGNVAPEEMVRTFNVGVGMVICINPNDVDRTLELLATLGEKAWRMGHIAPSDNEKPSVLMD